MKILLIADTHYGARNDSPLFLDYQNKSVQSIVIPTIDKYKIDTIIHLGDLVDRRRFINFNTSMRMREEFLDKIANCKVHIIAGNHDVYHKNTNDINAFNELLERYKFSIYTDPTEVVIDNNLFLFVPWINKDNRQKTVEMIEQTRSQQCFGHLELQGFEMQRGVVATHGDDQSMFDKFDVVCSGHYHQKSKKNNINYLGAPWEITWADYNCPRGIHLYDTQTRQLEFIQNTNVLFHRIIYNDCVNQIDKMIENVQKSNISGAFCKIVVEQKTNPFYFDRFFQAVEQMQPYDIKIVEQQALVVDDTVAIDQAEDTLTILNKTIDKIDCNVDKQHLQQLIQSLYTNAASLEYNQ